MLFLQAICVTASRLGATLPDKDRARIFIWSGALIGVLLLLFFVVSLVRHWVRKDESTSSTGFTLSDLRALHRQGKMTDEEFEQTKALMLGQAKRDAIKAMEASSRKPKDAASVPEDLSPS